MNYKLWFCLYNLLLLFFSFPLLLILTILAFLNKRIKRTLKHRLFFPLKLPQDSIWFHVSSVGELNSIKKLIILFQKRYSVYITTLTDTGLEQAKKINGNNSSILPLEIFFILPLFIKKLNPRMVIINETEIWPSLILYAKLKNIPVYSINTIITRKSYRLYVLFKFFFKILFSTYKLFFVQNKETEEILLQFDVPKRKILRLGNTKFDVDIPQKRKNYKKYLKIKNGIIITGGSTHAPEEEILIRCFLRLKLSLNYKIILILAPRHINRIKEVTEILKQYNLRFSLFSSPVQGSEVILIDKMGVLLDIYRISDICFVGGTFAKVGGHTPVEPGMFAKPVICGPHIFKNEGLFKPLLANKGGIMVKTEDELYRLLFRLIKDKRYRERTGRKAFEIIKKNQGISEKIFTKIISLEKI